MEYKIVTSSNPHTLSTKVNDYLLEGWEVVGSHSVVIVHSQNRFSGTTHKDTTHETEYSQTIVKNETRN